MSNSEEKIIFILGHGRSGTTLLNKVLSVHPDICFFGNEFNDLPYFYFQHHRYDKFGAQKYERMMSDFLAHPWLNFKLKPKVSAKNIRDFIAQDILGQFKQQQAKEVVGVKIANFIFENVQMIAQAFPNAYCIHIYRDPRDVYWSLKKNNFPIFSAYYVAKAWQKAVVEIQSLQGRVPHFFEIKYESLITRPEAEIRKICAFLGVPYSEKMVNFHKFIIDEPLSYHQYLNIGFVSDNFNKWQGNLSQREHDLIMAGAYQEMKNLGYGDLEEKKINLFTHVWEYLLEKLIANFKLLVSKKFLWFNRRGYRLKVSLRRWLAI